MKTAFIHSKQSRYGRTFVVTAHPRRRKAFRLRTTHNPLVAALTAVIYEVCK